MVNVCGNHYPMSRFYKKQFHMEKEKKKENPPPQKKYPHFIYPSIGYRNYLSPTPFFPQVASFLCQIGLHICGHRGETRNALSSINQLSSVLLGRLVSLLRKVLQPQSGASSRESKDTTSHLTPEAASVVVGSSPYIISSH